MPATVPGTLRSQEFLLYESINIKQNFIMQEKKQMVGLLSVIGKAKKS